MRVLIADDDAFTRRLLGINLKAIGHEAVEAENGKRAWELFQHESLRLVITDWMMPELDGPGLIREIRAANHPHYTYIILVTALTEKANIVAGLEAGADDYLIKPFHAKELRARVAIGERIIKLEENLRESQRQLEILAMRDGLTNLFNRRTIQEHAEAELNHACRINAPVSVVLLDIDLFKAVNDQYGHNNGDLALLHIAALVSQSVRPYDWVGRWGGEEFLVVLPGALLPDAGVIAERIRQTMANTPLELITGESISLHASFGVSSAPPPDNDYPSLEHLVSQADEALYRAKRQGRNRVCLHEFTK
jgi:two-component system chemotaxis response regulator CheY